MSDFLANLVRRSVGVAPVARARPVAVGPVVGAGGSGQGPGRLRTPAASPALAAESTRAPAPATALDVRPTDAPDARPGATRTISEPDRTAAANTTPRLVVVDHGMAVPRPRPSSSPALDLPSAAATPLGDSGSGSNAPDPAVGTVPPTATPAGDRPLTLERILGFVETAPERGQATPTSPPIELSGDPSPRNQIEPRESLGQAQPPLAPPVPVRAGPQPIEPRREPATASIGPATPRPSPRPAIDVLEGRRVDVRIGTIEILGADPAPAVHPSPAPASVTHEPAPPGGFDAFVRLRTYAPWNG